MAKAEVQGGKRGRKAAIKAAQQEEPGQVATLEPEPEEPEPPKPAKGKRGGTPKNISFFDRLAHIAAADWGSRAQVRVYRLEPITNSLIGSEKKYIKLYTQPPVTEERIKQDCGSGRYRLYLTFKAPAQDQKEVDSVEIDILDLKFPPQVPKGAWLDDPRNAQWAWAKDAYDKQNAAPQQQASAADTIIDAIDIVDRLKGNQGDSVKNTLDTIKAVREMTPAAPSATTELANLIAVADKLRPAETVPQFVQLQFQALQAEITAARKRTDDLMDRLIENNKTKPAEGNGLSLVKELVGGIKELMPDIKEIVPGFGENGGSGRQRPWWQEVALLIAPGVGGVIQPFANLAATAIAAKMMAPQPGSGVQPNPGQQVPAQLPAPGTMMPFLQMIAFPLVTHCRYMGPPDNEDPTEVGKDFALWVFNGYGSDSRYGQAILAAKAMGPTGIIAAFRGTPLWADKGPQQNLVSLAELEAKLPAFFGAFLSFDPNAIEPESDDEPEETDPGRPVIVETFSEQGAGY